MDAHDMGLVPRPFGLANTGAICYLNSYLQMLVGCSSFARAVLQNEEYLGRTGTGRAVRDFVQAYSQPPGGAPVALATHSARILVALTGDLAARRPRVQFGGGQESASELFIHLLDMMEPAEEGAGGASPESLVASVESPVTRLFLHRFRCELHCRRCRGIVSTETDHAVVFNLFHFDRMQCPPTNLADFSKAVRLQVSATVGYSCPTCREPTDACRIYTLTMVPEVIVCAFNLYTEYGGARRARYFPKRLELPAVGGGTLVFRLVGQVEHIGALSGGHYWARALRAGDGPPAPGERVYILNDTGVSPSAFEPTPHTYLLVYHFAGHEAPAGEA